jgi:hypothetical protein
LLFARRSRLAERECRASGRRMDTRTISLYVLLTVCLIPMALSKGQANQANVAVSSGITIGEVKNYRQMFRVNEKPITMDEITKAMCAPHPVNQGPHFKYAPNYDPRAVYYINEIARQGLQTFSEKKLFPVGSIIVKEKQERKTEDSVEVITVMKKVLPGRGEASWEYKMYDAKKWVEVDFSGQTVSPDRQTCVECHRLYKNNDYVSDRGMGLLFPR